MRKVTSAKSRGCGGARWPERLAKFQQSTIYGSRDTLTGSGRAQPLLAAQGSTAAPGKGLVVHAPDEIDREGSARQSADFADTCIARLPLIASLATRVHVWRRREDTKQAGARTRRATAARLTRRLDKLSQSTRPAVVSAALSAYFHRWRSLGRRRSISKIYAFSRRFARFKARGVDQ